MDSSTLSVTGNTILHGALIATSTLAVTGTTILHGAVTFGSVAAGYTFPIADGAGSGYLLTTDGNGVVTWNAPAAGGAWTNPSSVATTFHFSSGIQTTSGTRMPAV